MKVTNHGSGEKIAKIIGLLLLIMVITSPVAHHTVYGAKQEPSTGTNATKVASAVAAKQELTQDDLVIAGLKDGMSKEAMVKLLGTATSTENFTMDYFAGGKNVKFTKYNYPGISVMILDIKGQIIEIDITDKTYKTARGAKVGDPIAKIKELYGEEDLYSPSRAGQPLFVYGGGRGPEVLSFKVDPITKKVVTISVDSWSI